MSLFINIAGWLGAILILAAYFLISENKLKSSSAFYQILNLTGAILLIINTIYLGAYPSAFVNIIWVGIAAWSLIKHKE